MTNGIAYRRWLCQSDPLLTDYLKQLIGGDFLRDARALEKLLPYQNDEKVLADLMAIKRKNKERLAALIENQNGVRVDPDSIFDIQIKRLLERAPHLLHGRFGVRSAGSRLRKKIAATLFLDLVPEIARGLYPDGVPLAIIGKRFAETSV